MLKTKENKVFFILSAITLGLIFLLAFVTQPIYLSLLSDIVYQGSLITAFLYYFNTLFQDLTLSLVILLTVVGQYLYRGKKPMNVLMKILPFVFCALPYVCNIISTGFTEGFKKLTIDDFTSSGISILLDAKSVAVALLISFVLVKRHFANAKILSKAYRLSMNQEFDERTLVFPYKSFICLTSIIVCPLFFGILDSLINKILSTLYYDLFFWGLPSGKDEYVQMIQYYLVIIFIAAVSYTFAYFISYMFFNKKDDY